MRAPFTLVAMLAAPVIFAQENRAPVVVEFRVFAGAEEITHSTRLRLMPTGARDKASTMPEGRAHVASVPPGIYDVQALRMRSEGIVAIRWAERFVVMHYPDEGGRHLEVINFHPGYGALQVRATGGGLGAHDVAVFHAGEREKPAGEAHEGDGYRLFVLKAGRYDLRVRRAGSAPGETEWLLDVEVPADRTRLKFVDGTGQARRVASRAVRRPFGAR